MDDLLGDRYREQRPQAERALNLHGLALLDHHRILPQEAPLPEDLGAARRPHCPQTFNLRLDERGIAKVDPRLRAYPIRSKAEPLDVDGVSPHVARLHLADRLALVSLNPHPRTHSSGSDTQPDNERAVAAQLLHRPGAEKSAAACDENPPVRPECRVHCGAHRTWPEAAGEASAMVRFASAPRTVSGVSFLDPSERIHGIAPSPKMRSMSCWSLWVSIDLKKPL